MLPALLLAGLAGFAAAAQINRFPTPNWLPAKSNARVDALLKQMTLDEKVGQLVQYSAGYATGPAASNLTYDELVARGQVGSLLNVVGAEATNHYQRIAMEKSRLHVPLLFGLDVIHGHRTTFPVPLALAASWDPAAVETVARLGAAEARADGIPWVFSPMVDIARDPRWGRIVESNGEDPYLGSAMARAWVKGYQQDDLSKPGLGCGQREAFCRLWRGHRRPRLQRRGHERDHAAAGVSGAVSRRGRSRGGHDDELLSTPSTAFPRLPILSL